MKYQDDCNRRHGEKQRTNAKPKTPRRPLCFFHGQASNLVEAVANRGIPNATDFMTDCLERQMELSVFATRRGRADAFFVFSAQSCVPLGKATVVT